MAGFKLKELSVSIRSPALSVHGFSLPVVAISGTLAVDTADQDAAWELYVELVTRVATQPLEDEEGMLRETLSSLYALFGETRQILRKYGPSVARPKRQGRWPLGHIAVLILNSVLRPVLAYWHPVLKAYEDLRPRKTSPMNHERAWARNRDLRDVLKSVQGTLLSYAVCLSNAAGVPMIETPPRYRGR